MTITKQKMTLEELSRFISEKEGEFVTAIQQRAQSLQLGEIIDAVNQSPNSAILILDLHRIGVYVCEAQYYVQISPTEIIVSNDRFVLKTFNEPEIGQYYAKLEALILERNRKGNDNLPF